MKCSEVKMKLNIILDIYFIYFIHLSILFSFFEIWNTVYNSKTSLQNLAAGIQQNKQNIHKSMSTVGTIVYNSDLFSDINTINTMAAALYFHEQQIYFKVS